MMRSLVHGWFLFPALALVAVLPARLPADALMECEHCSKQLLPGVYKLVPGRKYARDRRIDIEHLRLEVTPDFAKRSVSGTMTMTFRPIAFPLAELELDAVDLDIAAVSALGADVAEHRQTDDKLILTFASPIEPGKKAGVTVRFSAEPERGLYFRTPEMGYKEGDTQVWSQGQADLHRFWFPCYDYPNERFTSEVICHVPDGMEVVSNGVLVASDAQTPDGLRTWHWRQDKPHVNYLIALAAGYFHKLEDKTGDLPLAMLVPPSHEKQAAPAFADTRKIVEFYNREIGVPFPWDKYFQVYCLDFVAGGMENTSCTFEAASILFNPETEQLRTLHRLDAHETAHQWFGDLLTCRDWSHLWLNEGFASYYTVLYEGERSGEDAMKYSLWREAQRVLKETDDKPTVWRDYGDPMQQFDFRVYPKGAWVLHMLRSQLGPDLYRECIRTYLERHRNQVVGTDDLHDVIEELSGLSFDQFFDQWLYHGGTPKLKVDYAWEPGTKLAKITVKQTQKLSDRVRLFRLPLPVAFLVSEQRGPLRFTMDVHQAEETFYFPLPGQPDRVRIDPDYTLLAEIDFKPPGKLLDAQLQSDVIGRLLAIRQLGETKDLDSISKLAAHLPNDPFFAVRIEAAEALGKRSAAPEARAALIAALQGGDPDARVREAIIKALAAQPHPDAQKALEAHAGTEKNPDLLAAVIQTWGARPADEAISARLRTFLDTPSFNETLAMAAIRAFRAQDDATAVPAILKKLRSAPLEFRTRDFGEALNALAFLDRESEDRESVRAYLVRHLNSPREELRAAAAKALGTLGDPKALAALGPLAGALSREDDPVQKAASASVTRLHSELAGPVELKNLWDEIRRLQKEAAEAKSEVEKLRKRLEPQKPQTEDKKYD